MPASLPTCHTNHLPPDLNMKPNGHGYAYVEGPYVLLHSAKHASPHTSAVTEVLLLLKTESHMNALDCCQKLLTLEA